MHLLQSWKLLGAAVLVLSLAACSTIPLFGSGELVCPSGSDKAGNPGGEEYCERANDAGEVVKDGPYVKWYQDAKQRQIQGLYRDGLREGSWTAWHENGNRMEQAEYRGGRKNGPFIVWSEGGAKRFEGTYREDLMHGLITEWYENGQKNKEIEYREGKKNGIGTAWYPSGEKKAEARFRDDRKQEETRFDSVGRKPAGE